MTVSLVLLVIAFLAIIGLSAVFEVYFDGADLSYKVRRKPESPEAKEARESEQHKRDWFTLIINRDSNEILLKTWRINGLGKSRSVIKLAATRGVSVAMAKKFVHESEAWAGCKDVDDLLHAALEVARRK